MRLDFARAYASLLAERNAIISTSSGSDTLYSEAFFRYESGDISAVFYLNQTQDPTAARSLLALALRLGQVISTMLGVLNTSRGPTECSQLPVVQYRNGAECHNGAAVMRRVNSGLAMAVDGGFSPDRWMSSAARLCSRRKHAFVGNLGLAA
mmetsp:Transcript_24064/g.60863  ORF Transcript_24064/g.60863 Transcript_24064/m.60863 type:complete len:152 (+) Transcript_24064:299-754(+)